MSELRPLPFAGLARHVFRAVRAGEDLFGLRPRDIFRGAGGRDLSRAFHGRRAATPLGPAAGPHTQLAQNIVLAWLAGGRILELKTVQVLDRLDIPRPCIDMATVGFNVEWSQELRLEESLEEYVRAALLIAMLQEEPALALEPGAGDTLFDISVGYDLAGIRSDGVRAFLEGMADAAARIDRLRGELPGELRDLAGVEVPARIASSATLSTFHGCPPDEIEAIGHHLLEAHGLHLTVKLNPTLLGAEECRGILREELGYRHLRVPDEAFRQDATWPQAVGIVGRLRERARELGLGCGVKLTNTLIVETPDGDAAGRPRFFPASEKVAYLSGRPLHVLALRLVERMRDEFGSELPISFSAGIDRENVADTVDLGLAPVTVCSDLLLPGGYGRLERMVDALVARLDERGERSLDDVCDRSAPAAAAAVARVRSDPRYRAEHNARPPRKTPRHLELFDCLTCDKCLTVCPNGAIFALPIDPGEYPAGQLVRDGAPGGGNGRAGAHGAGADGAQRWIARTAEPIAIAKRHQIAILADACNECGNCDVFCPEEGGPHRAKANFFASEESYRASATAGVLVTPGGARARMHGAEWTWTPSEDGDILRGPGVEVVAVRPEGGASGSDASPPFDVRAARGHVIDLRPGQELRLLAEAFRRHPLARISSSGD